MKVLILADRPPTRPIKEIISDNPGIQLIITLGDLYYYDIQVLAEITDIPKIGVYGNHCDGRYMESLGITNMHLANKTIEGISFFGYQGCVKYKESVLQSTQEYCQKVMKWVPRYDVLITHCPPRGLNDNDDPAHYGFDGLREYVDRVSPRYVLHWHTYDFGKFVDQYRDTKIVYVEREKIMEIEI